jgi:hypothetical protein
LDKRIIACAALSRNEILQFMFNLFYIHFDFIKIQK